MAKKKSDKKLKRKLLHKYRLVVLNEDTFEERVSFKLTRLNLFTFFGFSTIAIIALTFFLIAYTPLREYIPGYPSTQLRKQATQLMFETDSLKRSFEINKIYYASIRKVLTGDSLTVDFDKDSIIAASENTIPSIDIQPSRADSLLREKVAQEDRYNLFNPAMATVTNTLFPPVKGTITEPYDIDSKHYAVDVAVVKDEPVKAAADGTVIFSEWTADTGFVIILEHSGDLISVYKHNATLNKEQGDLVKAGEVVASVGSTGTLSTGPHLHFELWSGGYPVNPVNYINFE
ncbi:MAG: M23 family metallopeptidase [Leeuwenhoekiella sp.]